MDVRVGELLLEEGDDLLEIRGLEAVHLLGLGAVDEDDARGRLHRLRRRRRRSCGGGRHGRWPETSARESRRARGRRGMARAKWEGGGGGGGGDAHGHGHGHSRHEEQARRREWGRGDIYIELRRVYLWMMMVIR